MASSDLEAPVVTGKDVRGLCVVLDLVTHEPGWELLKSEKDNVCETFKDLNYSIRNVNAAAREDIETQLCTLERSIVEFHDSIVFFLVGKLKKPNFKNPVKKQEYDDQLNIFKGYMGTFDNCTALQGKPKILLQHLIEYDKGDDTDVDVYVNPCKLIVTSNMIGSIKMVKKTNSLFLEKLVQGLRLYSHQCNMIELMTKISYWVELRQHEDKRTSDINDVFQKVIFTVNDLGEFKFAEDPMANISRLQPFTEPAITGTEDMRKLLHFEVLRNLKDELRWPMTKNPRGFCVIVSITNNRAGGRLDEARMKTLFEELMYDVKVIRNEKHQVIRKRLNDIAKDAILDHQGLFVFLMAHGGKIKNDHVFADVEGFAEQSSYIYEAFDGENCKPLIGRPKVFIVQTCMGGSRMKGINTAEDARESGEDDRIIFYHTDELEGDPLPSAGPVQSPTAHKMSNTLIYHATLFGHKSYRSPKDGSFMIQAIDEIFREHSAKKDLYGLLNLVSGRIASSSQEEYEKETKQLVRGWQQPALREGTLNKEFQLNPGFSEDQLVDWNHKRTEIISLLGRTAWFTRGNESVIVVYDKQSDLREVYLNNTANPVVYQCDNKNNKGTIVSGIALNEAKHLALMDTRGGKQLVLLHIQSNADSKTWRIGNTISLPGETPIAICDVFKETAGVLIQRDTTLELQIHKRDLFNPRRPNDDIKLEYPNISKAIVHFVKDTILLLSLEDATLMEYSLDGQNQRELIRAHLDDSFSAPRPGYFYKPCAVTKDKDNIMVVCNNAIHVLKGGMWQIHSRLNRVNHMCFNKSYRIQLTDADVDTRTTPTVPDKLYDLEQSESIATLKEKPCCLWSTAITGVVAVGSMQSTCITLLSKDGNIVNTCPLLSPGFISNGLNVEGDINAIIIATGQTCSLKYVAIDPMFMDISIIKDTANQRLLPLGKGNKKENPIALFSMNTHYFGVLVYRTDNRAASVGIYSRQSRAKKNKVKLSGCIVDYRDTVCIDKNGFYFVTSYEKSIIKMYDSHGVLCSTFGNINAEQSRMIPGYLYRPCTLLVDTSNRLLVQCQDGILHRYNVKFWGIVPSSSGATSYIMYSESQLYCLQDDRVRIRTVNQIQSLSEILHDKDGIVQVPMVPLTPHGVRPATATHQLPEEYHRLWSTSTSGVVAVCSGVSSSISLINEDGKLLHTHDLGLDGRINSGIRLSGHKHAVIVFDWSVYCMRFVTIDTDTMNITLTDETCDVKNPVTLFSVNSQYIGALCDSSDTSPTTIHVIDRVTREVKHSVLLGYVDIDSEDKACMDRDNYFYISNSKECSVNMYDSDGTLLRTLGSKAKDADPEYGRADIPGELDTPYTLLVDENNCLLIHCLDTNIHRYNRGVWTILPCFLPDSWHILYHGRHVYSVCEDTVCIHTIVEKRDEQNDNTDVPDNVTVCPIITPSLTHVTTKSLTQQYSRVWTDGEVLILGGNRHTTLTIVTSDFKQILSHTLCSNDEADHIVSGSHIRDTLHAVIVNKFVDLNTLKLHIVNIDLQPSSVHIVRQLNVYKPLHVNNINPTQMAVLGWGDLGQPDRITLFRRDDLSENRHIPVCYGAGSTSDRIYKSGTGDWYISSYSTYNVYRLTSDGVNLGPVTTPARYNLDTRPGYVWAPQQIHQDTNMDMLVVCNSGIIHRKPRDKDTGWEIVAETKQLGGTAVWDVCFIGEYMFTIYQDKLAKFKIK